MKSSNAVMPANSAQHVVPFRRAQQRRREEMAFLPAALELVETPPSPVGRAIVGHDYPAVLRSTALGRLGHDRHRCVGNRKSRAERPHQGGSAI